MRVHQYAYGDARPSWANTYLWPVLKQEIAKLDWPDKRAFDLGCGRGGTCRMLSDLGFRVVGVDPQKIALLKQDKPIPSSDWKLAVATITSRPVTAHSRLSFHLK